MEKGAHQRAHLIDVARDLFAAQGYEATTTRALNQAAGTSDGLLYYYFPHGKQDILDTIVEEGLTRRANEFTVDFSRVDSKADLAEQLVRLIDGVWQSLAREDNYQSFIITVRNRMLLSQAGSDWLDGYTSGLEQRILAGLATVGPKLGYSEGQIPVLTSIIAALVISPLFTELLLRNQRTLAIDQLTQLKSQIEFLLAR